MKQPKPVLESYVVGLPIMQALVNYLLMRPCGEVRELVNELELLCTQQQAQLEAGTEPATKPSNAAG